MDSKDEKFKVIIDTVFKLVDDYGFDNITISLVASYSGVSRGWIYKYIANDIEGVLRFALKEYASEFARFSDLVKYSDKEKLKNSIIDFSKDMFQRLKKDPSIIKIYFSHYLSQNIIGEVIREIDQKYLVLLSENIKQSYGFSEVESLVKARLFHSMRMGALLNLVANRNDEELASEKEFLRLVENFFNHLAI